LLLSLTLPIYLEFQKVSLFHIICFFAYFHRCSESH
jgi:hypothetical protein